MSAAEIEGFEDWNIDDDGEAAGLENMDYDDDDIDDQVLLWTSPHHQVHAQQSAAFPVCSLHGREQLWRMHQLALPRHSLLEIYKH